jgi:hypothetical protein
MKISNIVTLGFLTLALPACVYVPVSNNDAESPTCKTYTHSMSLDVIGSVSNVRPVAVPQVSLSVPTDCSLSPECTTALAALAVGTTVAAGSAIISGSIVVSDNAIHWLEYQGRCDDGYLNKAKQALLGSIITPKSVAKPNVDLQVGVASHDFALIQQSLDKGADINFHDQAFPNLFCNLSNGRAKAASENRTAAYDTETEKLVDLLLSHGASPTNVSSTGQTFVDCTGFLPTSSLHKLLTNGWPNDYAFWLYAGVVLEKPEIIREAIANGADPNKPIRDARYLDFALRTPSELSDKGREEEQKRSLESLEILLKSGAKIDEGRLSKRGDIIKSYIYYGGRQNIQPVFELLIKYASPEAKKISLAWLEQTKSNMDTNHSVVDQNRQVNIEWLINKLSLQTWFFPEKEVNADRSKQ